MAVGLTSIPWTENVTKHNLQHSLTTKDNRESLKGQVNSLARGGALNICVMGDVIRILRHRALCSTALHQYSQ